jgi:predicted RNA-binding protein YlxR (DUF448 family)
MAKQARSPKPKHVPQRTCIACRQVAGKRGLIRLVRTETGVEIDPTGKLAGRGAYLHPSRECWNVVLKGNRIEQALRMKLSQENRRSLLEYAQSLPEADDVEPPAAATNVQTDAA